MPVVGVWRAPWRHVPGAGACLAALVLLALAIRLTPLPSWPSSDSANYVAVAWNYVTPESGLAANYAGAPHDPHLDSGPMAFSVRQGLTGPLAIPIKLLGFSPFSFSIVPLAFGLLEVVLAFLVGRALAGTTAGLLAAAIVATLPWSVGESRYARADQVSATLAYLGVYAAAFDPLGTRLRLLSALIGGLLLAWAWLTKETTAFVYVGVLAAVLLAGGYRGQGLTKLLVVASTLLVALLLECATYQYATGDPLYRFHAMEVNQEQCKGNFFTAESAVHGWRDTTYERALLKRLLLSGPRALLLAPASFGLLLLGAICAAWTVWPRKADRPSRPMQAACYLIFSLLLIYNFSTTSLTHYRPIPAIHVYFYPLVLPSAAVVAATVVGLAARAARPRTIWMPVAAVLALCAVASIARSFRNDEGARYLDSLLARLEGGALVLTDPQTASELSQRISRSPLPASQVVPWTSGADNAATQYVLIRPALVGFLRQQYGFEGPRLDELVRDAQPVESNRVFELWQFPDR